MQIQTITNRGRKGEIGKVVSDADSLAFFAGYNDCGNCGMRGKILLNTDDIRYLSKKLGYGSAKREPVTVRITRRLAKHYDI